VLARIGDLKRSSGDNQGALTAFEETLAIARGFAEQSPGPDTQRELALNLTKIGAVKRELGDRDGALAALEESLAIRRALPQTDLSKWQIDVAENLETIGDLKLAPAAKARSSSTRRCSFDAPWWPATRHAQQRNMSIPQPAADGLALGDTAGAL
jgi:hypothetical protein